MGVVQITSEAEYEAKVNNAEGPVVVDFFATWCGPCKVISPAIEKLSNDHGSISFYKVDVDDLGPVAAKNGISAMPTFIFRKGGQQVEVVKGANPPAINAAVQRLLN